MYDELLIDPPSYPRSGTYADLLLWHLRVWWTRPEGNTTQRGEDPWEIAIFRDTIFKDYKGKDPEGPSKKFRSYIGLYQKYAPSEGQARVIARNLFGGKIHFKRWENDLDQARIRSRGKGRNIANISVSTAIAELEKALSAEGAKPKDCSTASIPDLTPHFIGRDEDVADLANALVATGQIAVLVQGGPGMGKTELTKAVAHHEVIAARYGERRWFVTLDAATDAQKLLDAISVGIGTDPNLGLAGILVRLGSAPGLLILDNLETPWEPEGHRAAVQEILQVLCGTIDLTLIASIRGDRIPEGIDWSDVRHADALTPKYAASLFSRIAQFKTLPTQSFGFLLQPSVACRWR